MKYVGDLEKTFLAIWRKVFGDLEKTCLAIWRNSFGDLEKTCSGDLEKMCSVIWRKLVRRKRWRFGETWLAQLWRFHIGVRYGVAKSSATVSGD